MFVIMMTYTVPVEEVEPHISAHLEWLAGHKAAGSILTAGRRVPRTGGVFLAPSSVGAGELAGILDQDPFKRHNLAEYEVTEFVPSTTAPGFELLSGI